MPSSRPRSVAIKPVSDIDYGEHDIYLKPCTDFSTGTITLELASSGADLNFLRTQLEQQLNQALAQESAARTQALNAVTYGVSDRVTVAGYAASLAGLAEAPKPAYTSGEAYANWVLVNNPTNPAENGIYNSTTGTRIFTDASDYGMGLEVIVDQTNSRYYVATEPAVGSNGSLAGVSFVYGGTLEDRPYTSLQNSAIRIDGRQISLDLDPQWLAEVGSDGLLSISAAFQTLLNNLQQEVQTATDTNASQATQIQSLSTGLQERVTIDDTQTSQITSLLGDVGTLTTGLNSEIQSRSLLGATVDTHTTQIGQLQTTDQQIQGAINQLLQKDGQLDTKDAQLQQGIDTLTAALDTKDTPAQRDTAISNALATYLPEVQLKEGDSRITRSRANGITTFTIDLGKTGYRIVEVTNSGGSVIQLTNRSYGTTAVSFSVVGDIPLSSGYKVALANFTALNF